MTFAGFAAFDYFTEVQTRSFAGGRMTLEVLRLDATVRFGRKSSQPVNVPIRVEMTGEFNVSAVTTASGSGGTLVLGEVRYGVGGPLLGPAKHIPGAVFRAAAWPVNKGLADFFTVDFLANIKAQVAAWTARRGDVPLNPSAQPPSRSSAAKKRPRWWQFWLNLFSFSRGGSANNAPPCPVAAEPACTASASQFPGTFVG